MTGLPDNLAAIAVTPDHPDYALRRSSYMAVGSPTAVLMARDDADVAAALSHASRLRADGSTAPFSVRSGGHGIAGTSTNSGGIVLDLSRMNRISPAGSNVRVQAGATWGDVAAHLGPQDQTITSGNFGDTGVGGLATAGGVGYFARSQGLTLDRVRAATLITADGVIHHVDAEHEPDLFWALRGGATQVGVVTEVDLEPMDMHTSAGDASIIFQQVQFLVPDLSTFTPAWAEWIDSAPREAESFLMLNAVGGGRYVVQARNVWAGDDVEAATPTLESALELAHVLDTSAQIQPYASVVPSPKWPHQGQQSVHMRDVLVEHADAAVGAAMADALAHDATLVGELRALGGAVSDVAPDATAWAGRSQRALAGIWARPAGYEAEDEAFAALQELGTGTYAAYSSDTRPSAAALAWPGATGERLRALAAEVDPHGLFASGHSLRVAELAAV
ncbi:FAD-binding oxidoreductase [Microbacterium gorillae]|uniref:FAD-binding oxidoreductase n=1 Tax=Microbacterium gorillae TaxID=1231063 RepID=UPI000693F195|nr:FAD-dependent oxidoreductase [Microbacterium gorillae]